MATSDETVCPCCEAPEEYDGSWRYALCQVHAARYPYPIRIALCDANRDEDVTTKWVIPAGSNEPMVFHYAYSDIDDWIEIHNMANDLVRFIRVSDIVRCGIKHA